MIETVIIIVNHYIYIILSLIFFEVSLSSLYSFTITLYVDCHDSAIGFNQRFYLKCRWFVYTIFIEEKIQTIENRVVKRGRESKG